MPNKTRLRKSSLAVTMVSALLVLAGCGTNASATTVATYNGGTLSQPEFETQLHIEQLLNPTMTPSPTIQTDIAKQYIVLTRLILPIAQKAVPKMKSSVLHQDTLQFEQNIIGGLYSNNSTTFNQKMQSLKLTEADLETYVSQQLALSSYAQTLVKTIPLSEQKLYYKNNLEQYTTVTEQAILVKSKSLAQSLANQLRAGASWKTLAAKYSQDPGSAKNSGIYANQSPTNWVPPFAQHAMTQPIGQVGQPFDSTYGWFVMRVISRTTQPFSKVQSSVMSALVQQNEKSAFLALYNQKLKTANIKVTLPKA
ncbi:peptidylprolyl isomerase [Ferroacidibacillus organovorans]|uniref:PpiC domain-containing protein n=1 Tax=Ferroacidibacillus organovorans TaxID=1765683 RepID=A0A101XS96_9BACL|nr:peptidylprolyl isomerase [Ferroacidibacillus organovorans]KUO96607.1 hypothetical protein ATW55_00570 [Ferroacidibacillus organovorans]